jgi:hypothetical protein
MTTLRNTRWGRWYLDTTEPVSLNIVFEPDEVYDIVLARCKTVDDRMFWINHMAEKTLLITNQDINDLKLALNELLENTVISA